MKWSLSSIGTYEKCAYQYKLRYIDKLSTPQRSDAANRGVNAHAEIEAYIKKDIEKLGEELERHTTLLQGLRDDQSALAEYKVAFDKDWNKVEWDDKNVWYRGIFDLKTRKGDEVTVYDWKTGKIYDEHDDQKSLYSLAAFAEDPAVRWVRAIHVYLDLGKQRARAYSRDEMHQLRELWESRVRKLEEETEWLPNPSFKCRYCPFSKAQGGPCRF